METRRALGTVVASGAVIAFMALTSPRAGRTQESRAVPADVRVVNTASAPVLTRILNGTAAPVPTSILNVPTVRAQQNGAWGVSVLNPVASPVRTRDAADTGQRFAENFGGSIASNYPTGTASVSVPLAANQRLLIEEITLDAQLPAGQKPYQVRLQTVKAVQGGYTGVIHLLTTAAQGSDGTYDHFAATHPVRLYHDSNGGNFPISIDVKRAPRTGAGYFNGSVTGRIVLVPGA